MTTTLPRSRRATVAAGLAAGLAALFLAAPAQAELTAGLKNGGCIQGIQVGHVHNSDGSVTPICRTVD